MYVCNVDIFYVPLNTSYNVIMHTNKVAIELWAFSRSTQSISGLWKQLGLLLLACDVTAADGLGTVKSHCPCLTCTKTDTSIERLQHSCLIINFKPVRK